MALSCPSCSNQVTLPHIPLREDIEIYCEKCNAKLNLVLSFSPSSQGAGIPLAPAPIDSKKVLVSVIGEVTEEMISEVLSDAGLNVVKAISTDHVLESVVKHRPGLAILDVGLEGVFDKIIPRMKNENALKDMKILLLSSIHNKARYKREPESLYGADDYVERHHIEDQLVYKVQTLLKLKIETTPLPASKPVETPKSSAPVAQVKPAEPVQPVASPAEVTPPPVPVPSEGKTVAVEPSKVDPAPKKQAPPAGDLAEHDAAKRLARLIISDIALYNQKQVEEGVKNGNFHDLLKDELGEGLKLYETRTPEVVAQATDYYGEAISEFVSKQKARFGV